MGLLPLDPFSQPGSYSLPPAGMPSIISIMSSNYTFLTILPHISTESLHFPASEIVWFNLDEGTLRTRRNRSEKAIMLYNICPAY